MVIRLAAFALAFAAATPALAIGNSARDLAMPSHGISCERGIKDMESEAKAAAIGEKQMQQALQGLETARQACQTGDRAAAEQALQGVRQLFAGE
ncbi:hypothetical protein SAMN06265365_101709 [Tistlia consotensis]|uniref:Uncharacterized protein n=1 Tax=Tistlia consotensis USBA 355 TaxID=560819 RepID=A0A1Y6BBP3_9PROT|nr:hypothetical protein [Tistlia consotensis]SME94730.1 hypothetical protein SAMN05428998_101708 [Tistlia consotensis USBA 355]SNR29527.1 hypothetical protein SAMN06265365_101709 [Tistlia consotensis]